MNVKLINAIETHCKNLGITKEKFIENSELPRSNVWFYMMGKSTPRVDKALILANELGKTVEELWGKN